MMTHTDRGIFFSGGGMMGTIEMLAAELADLKRSTAEIERAVAERERLQGELARELRRYAPMLERAMSDARYIQHELDAAREASTPPAGPFIDTLRKPPPCRCCRCGLPW
jgi:hypothetical protein